MIRARNSRYKQAHHAVHLFFAPALKAYTRAGVSLLKYFSHNANRIGPPCVYESERRKRGDEKRV
jgi:hypothetical protein